MMDCGCDKRGITNCEVIGIVLAIIVGIAAGIIYFQGIIPLPVNFILIGIILSVISLAILLGSLFSANVIEGCNGFKKCICKYGKFLLAGSIGTFLATTIAAIIGVTTVTILSTIFIAISAFFFVIIIVSLVCLINCIIKHTCREAWE